MALSPVLQFSDRVFCLPIIHGSGDFAIEVRRVMLSQRFDCLAVPLPPSFQHDVEQAITTLPSITLVMQEEPADIAAQEWTGDDDDENDDDEFDQTFSYVPIDPCQGVITALRIALQERLPRAFVDLETSVFDSYQAGLPDPYALKQVSSEKFAAALLRTRMAMAHTSRERSAAAPMASPRTCA